MLVRAFTIVMVLIAGATAGAGVAPPAVSAAHDHTAPAVVSPAASVAEPLTASAPTIPPDETFNEFLPEERGIGECISALEKPGCGSKARGGWRQSLLALALVLALAFIAWRIVRSARRTPRPADDVTTK